MQQRYNERVQELEQFYKQPEQSSQPSPQSQPSQHSDYNVFFEGDLTEEEKELLT